MAKPSRGHSSSITQVEACVSPSEGRILAGKDATLREWLLSNQIGISLTILTMIFAVHNLYPSLKPYTSPFLSLPHYQPATGMYTQGLDDVYFVMSSIIFFTAIRAITIDWLFFPFGRRMGMKPKAAIRFAEQGWLLVYYVTFWSYGLYIWVNSRYWMNFREIWTEWPSRQIPGYFKLYCLLQLSIWLQQILAINIEERRSDHYQMLTHHIITSALLGSAYVYSFYNVANVVLCIMDIVDFLLPAAKMLKYAGFERLCTVAFAVFLGTWVVARHILYPMLWWSIYSNVPEVMPFGCYSGATGHRLPEIDHNTWRSLIYPFLDINGPICMSLRIKWTFLSLLMFLQVLSLIWFAMILRIAFNVATGSSAEDIRSDDEDEDVSGQEVDSPSKRIPNDQDHSENGWSKSVSTNGSTQNHYPVRIRTARGRVSLSDHNERKALLRRIGCDKPS